MSVKVKDDALRKMIAAENPIPFTEDFEIANPDVRTVFNAKSFTDWVKTVIPEYLDLPIIDDTRSIKSAVSVGDYSFARMRLAQTRFVSPYMFASALVERRATLPVYVRGKEAKVAFSGTIYIPVLYNHRGTWMSLVPNEVLTLRKLVRYAKGNVALAGMGLGWLAQRVLQQPRVKSVTVVELDKAVLDYFGRQVQVVADSVGKPLKLVHADAYSYDWMQHEQGLWDIWLNMRDGSDDSRFWRICHAMRDAGLSCHGWYTQKPSQDCVWKMRKEDRERAEKEGKSESKSTAGK